MTLLDRLRRWLANGRSLIAVLGDAHTRCRSPKLSSSFFVALALLPLFEVVNMCVMMGPISFPIKFSGPTLAVSVDESNSLF